MNNLYLFQSSDAIYKLVPKKNKESDNNSFILLETDRQRIAKDLHDTSLQNLTLLIHKIELCSMYIDKDPLQAKLELSLINKNLKSTIQEVRDTIFNLRPMEFDDLGLKAAFERLFEKININKKYKVNCNVEDVSCENDTILLIIYRIVQECLNNIEKHASATEINFNAKHNKNKYMIIIQDNGKGFTQKDIDEKRNHFGITLMKERINILKGVLNIFSNELGTRVEIEIPIEKGLIIR